LRGNIKNYLILNKVAIKIRDKPIKFDFTPYLIAKEKIQKKLDLKGAGLS
jgi:hypothetical protein